MNINGEFPRGAEGREILVELQKKALIQPEIKERLHEAVRIFGKKIQTFQVNYPFVKDGARAYNFNTHEFIENTADEFNA